MRRLIPAATSLVSTSQTAPPSGQLAESTADPLADREWSLDEIADAYGYPSLPEGRGWLRGNMVASLDGAASHDGRSQPLSCAADMRIFGVLRGLADAIVVGAQTVRQEGYRGARVREAFAARRAAAGQPPAAAIAVVSASLDLDFEAPLFAEPVTPTVLLTGAGAPAERLERARKSAAVVLLAGEGAGVDPARIPGLLAQRGFTRLLTEGGPTLLGQFAASGVLDELCLTMAPRITVGSAPRITEGPGLEVPSDFTLESLLEESGFLFTRYRRRSLE